MDKEHMKNMCVEKNVCHTRAMAPPLFNPTPTFGGWGTHPIPIIHAY